MLKELMKGWRMLALIGTAIWLNGHTLAAGEYSTAQEYPRLIHALRSADRSYVKAALTVLVEPGDPNAEVGPALFEVFTKAARLHDFEVMDASASALSIHGPTPPQALKPLFQAYQQAREHKPMREWRSYIYAIGGIESSNKDRLSTLEKLLHDSDEHVVLCAVKALSCPRLMDRYGPVALKLTTSHDPELACEALRMIGRSEYMDSNVIPTLTANLFNSNRDVRCESLYALANEGSAAKPAVPTLATLLKSKDSSTVSVTLAALEKLGPYAKEAIPAIEQHLLHPSKDEPERRKDAAHALGSCGLGPARQILIEAIKGADPVLAVACADAVSKYPTSDLATTDALIFALTQRDARLRETACIALGKIGHPASSALQPLTALLKDGSSDVREGATRGILRISQALEQSDALDSRKLRRLPPVLESVERELTRVSKNPNLRNETTPLAIQQVHRTRSIIRQDINKRTWLVYYVMASMGLVVVLSAMSTLLWVRFKRASRARKEVG